MTGMSHDGKQRRLTAGLILRGKSSRPTMPCDGPRMNPSVDVGNPPRSFRHLRMTERRTPDPSSSRVPVHSALVQKSVTVITNLVGRLSTWMLGKSRPMRKGKYQKRWQGACNQSNHARDSGLAMMSASGDFPLRKPAEQAAAPYSLSATPINILQFPFPFPGHPVEVQMVIAMSLPAPNNWFLPEPLRTPVPAASPEFDVIQDADSSPRRSVDTGCANDW
jgi:hypothetical protein